MYNNLCHDLMIINDKTLDVIYTILTNRALSFDEAIECAGEYIPKRYDDDPDVRINGKDYWSDELAVVNQYTLDQLRAEAAEADDGEYKL